MQVRVVEAAVAQPVHPQVRVPECVLLYVAREIGIQKKQNGQRTWYLPGMHGAGALTPGTPCTTTCSDSWLGMTRDPARRGRLAAADSAMAPSGCRHTHMSLHGLGAAVRMQARAAWAEAAEPCRTLPHMYSSLGNALTIAY